MADFKIAETDNFQKKVSTREFHRLYSKIQAYIYPLLKANPFFGSNIKKLKGKLSEFYRYRTGNVRIFYSIDSDRKMVLIIDIDKRKDAYKKK